MKSLTYFSKFTKNKEGDQNNDGGLNIQTLKESMDNIDRKSIDRVEDEAPTEDEHQQLNES